MAAKLAKVSRPLLVAVGDFSVSNKASKPKIELLESDMPDGPWTKIPAHAIKSQILSIDDARKENPSLNWFLPIDLSTELFDQAMAVNTGISSIQLAKLHKFFGPGCTLQDIRAWFKEKHFRFEGSGWPIIIELISRELAKSEKKTENGKHRTNSESEQEESEVGVDNSKPVDIPVKLRDFIQKCCETSNDVFVDSCAEALLKLARRKPKKIELRPTNTFKSGRAYYYQPSYLIKNWPAYQKAISSLPNLKACFLTSK